MSNNNNKECPDVQEPIKDKDWVIKEKLFIGYGEDESSNLSTQSKKPKKPSFDSDLNNFLGDTQTSKLDSLQKFLENFVEPYDQDSGFKSGDFRDKKHSLFNALHSIIGSSKEDALIKWVEAETDFDPNGFIKAISEEYLMSSENQPLSCSPRESLDSSLGILNFSDLSSFSCDSITDANLAEAPSNRMTEDDPQIDALFELEVLQHQNRNLREERGRLLDQVSQTEDLNTQLLLENDEIKKKKTSLQNVVDKLKEEEKEYLGMKVSLCNMEESNQRLHTKLAQQEKENVVLDSRIVELNEEIKSIQCDNEELERRLVDATAGFDASTYTVYEMKEENKTIQEQLNHKTLLLEEKEKLIMELLDTTESLKQQKIDLEKQLCKAEEDIASLQHATVPFRRNTSDSDDEDAAVEETLSCSTTTNANCSNCSGCAKITTPLQQDDLNSKMAGHFKETLLSSTPIRPGSLVRKMSLCAEMRDVVRLNGAHLPSPFCGKHIFPAALYNKDSDDSPSQRIGDKRGLSISDVNESEVDSPIRSTKILKLSEEAVDLLATRNSFNLIEKDFKDTGSSESFAEQSIGQETLVTLQEINQSLNRINTETVPVIQPYPGSNCVLNEPVPNPINPDATDESLKDQINTELKILRNQIAKTQAILSYLHSKGKKIPGGISSSFSLISDEEQAPKAIHKVAAGGLCHSYNSDLLPAAQNKSRAFWLKENVRPGSNSPSQKSTPLHKSRCLTRSCPNLPSQWSVINRATQTEHNTQQGIVSNKDPSLDDSSVLDRSDESRTTVVSPTVLRNRSLSYMKAVTSYDSDTTILKDSLSSEKQDSLSEDNHDTPINFEERSRADSDVRLEDISSQLEDYDSQDNQGSVEKARKRRRSFSEHKTNYSAAFDLSSEREENCSPEPSLPMQVTLPNSDVQQRKLGVVEKMDSPILQPVLSQDMSAIVPSTATDILKFPKSSAAFNARNDKSKRREFPAGPGRRFLMPDVMETSETESAKDSANGSMESEGPEATGSTGKSDNDQEVKKDVLQPPPPSSDPCFPSLPDEFLRKLSLEKGSAAKPEELTAVEVEGKFSTLSLAFKTDKFTLSKRLELQKRQRDTAEGNISKEVDSMKDALNSLNHLCNDSHMRELIVKLQRHVEIIHQSTSRMSSRAEVYGAVQQEFRARLYSAVTPMGSNILGSFSSSVATPPATPNQRSPFPKGGRHSICGGSIYSNSGTLQQAKTSPSNQDLMAALERMKADEEELEKEKLEEQDGDKTLTEPSGSISLLSESSETSTKENDVETQVTTSPVPLETEVKPVQQVKNRAPVVQSLRSRCQSPLQRQLPVNLFSDENTQSNNPIPRPSRPWHSHIHIDLHNIMRWLRYGVVTMLLIGALLSLVFTFLPHESTGCNTSGSSGGRSIQEILEGIFRPHLSMKYFDKPV